MRVELKKDVFNKDSPPKPSKTKAQQRRYYHKEGKGEKFDVSSKSAVFEESEANKNLKFSELEENTSKEIQAVGLEESVEGMPTTEASKRLENSPLKEHSVRSTSRVESKEISKEEKKKHRKRVYREEKKKKKSKLQFEDESKRTPPGNVVAPVMETVGRQATMAVHRKVDENEDDNLAVEATHRTEEVAEVTASKLYTEVKHHRSTNKSASSNLKMEQGETKRSSSLQFGNASKGETTDKKATASHEFQKKQYKRNYAFTKKNWIFKKNAAEEAAQKAQKVKKKKERAVRRIGFFRRHKLFALISLGLVLVLVMILVMGGVAGTLFSGTGSTIMQSTYLASDDEIYAAEDYYSALEDALQAQIDNVRQAYPGYDEYNFQVDEISHNPYQLTSYLTVLFGNYKEHEIRDALTELFQEQYRMRVEGSTQTITDTRTVRVGESLGSVVTSGYCNCSICCGRWSGGATASGAMPQANHTIAVDAQNPIVPMGTKIVMNGVEYTVEDTGNFARYGVAFDVYYGSHAEASAHGHKNWEAYLADDNGSQTVEVTQTRTVRVLNVSLTNQGLDVVAKERLDSTEAVNWYNILNTAYGNRDYLWDTSTIGGYQPGGMSYEIPPEALSDEKFRNMITEAEKYLGYPYVWGGASPSTSFDCSGFVSWVINNCGNGWNYGRLTAEGLRGVCTYVPPDQAKPGDLIFFQGTYDTAGASHIGIYVGNGMMIHCGNPIQYTSTETSYWQQHFYCFGRLP